jgi:hypothetical protein
MRPIIGFLLVLAGVAANNVVYLQDLWLGQGCMSLDSAQAYAGVLISIGIVILGAVLMFRRPAALG